MHSAHVYVYIATLYAIRKGVDNLSKIFFKDLYYQSVNLRNE